METPPRALVGWTLEESPIIGADIRVFELQDVSKRHLPPSIPREWEIIFIVVFIYHHRQPKLFQVEIHPACNALCLALAKAGNNKAAKMAMIAITTSSSISVKAKLLSCNLFFKQIFLIFSNPLIFLRRFVEYYKCVFGAKSHQGCLTSLRIKTCPLRMQN